MMIVLLFVSKYQLKILKNTTIIITGKRNPNGLWDIPLTTEPPPPPNITNNSKHDIIIKTETQVTKSPTLLLHEANSVLRLQKNKQDLAKYLAGSLFNPLPSTFLQAIRLNILLFSQASLQT